jgi:hypothetical protein
MVIKLLICGHVPLRILLICLDIKPLLDVFVTYRTGDVKVIEEKLDLLGEKAAQRIASSLAVLALNDRNPDILKVCLDREFTYHNYFIDVANKFEKENIDPEVCNVLQASKFRQMWPWPIPKEDDDENDDDEETDPAEAFDYGGEYEVDW